MCLSFVGKKTDQICENLWKGILRGNITWLHIIPKKAAMVFFLHTKFSQSSEGIVLKPYSLQKNLFYCNHIQWCLTHTHVIFLPLFCSTHKSNRTFKSPVSSWLTPLMKAFCPRWMWLKLPTLNVLDWMTTLLSHQHPQPFVVICMSVF